MTRVQECRLFRKACRDINLRLQKPAMPACAMSRYKADCVPKPYSSPKRFKEFSPSAQPKCPGAQRGQLGMRPSPSASLPFWTSSSLPLTLTSGGRAVSVPSVVSMSISSKGGGSGGGRDTNRRLPWRGSHLDCCSTKTGKPP